MISSIVQTPFLIKIRPNMSERKKKQQLIYDLLNAETKPKVSLSTVYKAKKKILQKKELFKEKVLNQKTKRRLFNCSRNGD